MASRSLAAKVLVPRSCRMLHAATRHAQCVSRRWGKEIRKRTRVTCSIEPPPSTVQERPCELVLAEDSIYQTSWKSEFSEILPRECGIQFCHVSLEDCTNLEEGMEELRKDLMLLSNVAMVARGPLMSLLAQYYLESYPLAGLALVDPVLPSHLDVLRQLEGSSDMHQPIVNSILAGNEIRPLNLEPGAVPMLIIQSSEDDRLKLAAKEVAYRHSDPEGPFGDIRSFDATTVSTLKCIDIITDWIDEEVL